jgi:hypothetical protein
LFEHGGYGISMLLYDILYCITLCEEWI